MEVAGFSRDRSTVDDVVLELLTNEAQPRGHVRSLYSRAAKRLIDFIGAVVLLALLSPIFLITVLLVLRDSPGSVIFRQTRIGKSRVPFVCYKFRSMVVDAEEMLRKDSLLLGTHAVNWKIISDPRVTRFGRFIRKTSIDELPQLVNVLKGEMSLVGPRPYMPSELKDEYGIYSGAITSVRPGMTGLWQVSGRALLTPHQRIELDTEYASRCSFFLDVRIVFKTITVVILGIGAC